MGMMQDKLRRGVARAGCVNMLFGGLQGCGGWSVAIATVVADAVATKVIHEPGIAAADVGVVGDARSETTAGVGQTSEGAQAG
jgi:hypothetical protein